VGAATSDLCALLRVCGSRMTICPVDPGLINGHTMFDDRDCGVQVDARASWRRCGRQVPHHPQHQPSYLAPGLTGREQRPTTLGLVARSQFGPPLSALYVAAKRNGRRKAYGLGLPLTARPVISWTGDRGISRVK
jgi:hypothetical protein